jgi:hypothetical protein
MNITCKNLKYPKKAQKTREHKKQSATPLLYCITIVSDSTSAKRWNQKTKP